MKGTVDMQIGFTGTREGMTQEQYDVVRDWLSLSTTDKVHHGDCVGADADFHLIAKALGIKVKGHPPIKDDYRANCEFDEEAPVKSYYARNRDIVNESDILIATPKESEEQTKGGTWYTVGYARTVNKPTMIVWPDGSIEPLNAE